MKNPIKQLPLAFVFLALTSGLGALPEPVAAPLRDCNRNGVADSVDIAFGTSSDANANGVPDECDSLPLDGPHWRG
ncbi:MAG: hypothetical protein ACI9F9_001647 [Candidatus Paceibacteria bacterium]